MSEAPQSAEHWFVTHLPRLHEFYTRSDKTHPDNYFTKLIPNFLIPVYQKAFMPTEHVLEKLDAAAWEELIRKALPYVTKRDKRRGCDQLFHHLEEARGWVWLRERGFQRIYFIEDKSGKAPDFFAQDSRSTAILEVKTINRSDATIARYSSPIPEESNIVAGLTPKFKARLLRGVRKARGQLQAYSAPVDRRIALLVVQFDFDEMILPENIAELKELVSNQAMADIELACEISA